MEKTLIKTDIYNRQLATINSAIGIDLLDRFIAFLDASPATIATYKRNIKQFFVYLADNEIQHPQRADILAYKEYLADNNKKATTIQNYIIALRLFFTWTETEQLYPNVAAHIKGARLDREPKRDYLTGKQIKAVLATTDKNTISGLRDYAMLVLMTTGGLRTIEVTRAKIEDLRTVGDSPVLYIQGKGKQDKTRFIKLSDHAERAIRAYLKTRGQAEPTAPLFTSTGNRNTHSPMTTRSISRIVKQHFILAGYDSPQLTAHSLRHTAVTLSLLAGEKLQEVQDFARHANIATTQIYAHNIDHAKNTCMNAIDKAIFKN